MIKSNVINKINLQQKTLYTLFFIALAVALPQVIHTLGAISSTGTISGEVLLPMHIPVILAGFIAGPLVGGVVGLCSPLLSFALSGMPTSLMLPFMMVELCAYGVIAGLLSKIKLNNYLRVSAILLGGRIVKSLAILIAVYAFSYNQVLLATIYTSVLNGLLGIGLQFVILPLLFNKFSKNV